MCNLTHKTDCLEVFTNRTIVTSQVNQLIQSTDSVYCVVFLNMTRFALFVLTSTHAGAQMDIGEFNWDLKPSMN